MGCAPSVCKQIDQLAIDFSQCAPTGYGIVDSNEVPPVPPAALIVPTGWALRDCKLRVLHGGCPFGPKEHSSEPGAIIVFYFRGENVEFDEAMSIQSGSFAVPGTILNAAAYAFPKSSIAVQPQQNMVVTLAVHDRITTESGDFKYLVRKVDCTKPAHIYITAVVCPIIGLIQGTSSL